jgi:RHS repeat-associated protein
MRLASRFCARSGGVNAAYDFENHLIQRGAGISIVYDGDGNRASKTVGGVTTTYLVDDFNPTGYPQVIYEGFSGGSGARELYHTYVYGLERISQNRNFFAGSQQTQISYYVYDGHGSTRALTDPSGNVTDTYDYDAFGNEIHSTGTTPNEFLFAGEQYDSDLHLYYNRARYLNTSTGRFWTMDSFDGDAQSPISLHKYLYAGADTINLRDPSGNDDLPDILGALAVASVILNGTSLLYHLHKAFTANSPQEQSIETTLVYTDTLGLFLALVGGGFAGPTSSLAAAGGGVLTVASVSTTTIVGSLAIPGAANLVYFAGNASSGGGSGGGGGGSGSIGVQDDHVDVPKHNLNQLAPTYGEQRQLLIDAVEKISNALKLGSNADGDAFEATVDIINSSGKPVTTTIRWFRYTDGTQTINTAFVPPATP